MIATVSGRLQFLYSDRAIVDVKGVGYELLLSTDSLSRLGEVGDEVFLFVHTHVREDALHLFGFLEEEEKELFLLLIGVSGIGPKLAMAILSGMRVGTFCQAVVAKDVKGLTTIKGLGKKTAERICVELKDKLATFAADGNDISAMTVVSAGASSVMLDVLSALINLGYPDPVARQALARVKRRVGEDVFSEMQLEEMLKEGLRALA